MGNTLSGISVSVQETVGSPCNATQEFLFSDDALIYTKLQNKPGESGMKMSIHYCANCKKPVFNHKAMVLNPEFIQSIAAKK